MATCNHAGCGCMIYLDELLRAADMRRKGKCVNCGHLVNAHPRNPAGYQLPIRAAGAGGFEETRQVPENPSEKIGIMDKPDVSTSTIANKIPEIYDVFAQVCGAGSYIPNLRLQQLLAAPVVNESAIQFMCELAQSLNSVDTFRNVDQGSETMVGDINLQVILSNMASYSKKSLTSMQQPIPDAYMHLAKSASPDHCLFASSGLHGLPLIVGAEAKGMEACVQQCYPQLIAVCGSSCLELNRIGLSREDCVVPVVAMAGASCQFLATYLVRDSFPVLVALSPLLSPFGAWDEQKEVAKWCLRLVAFARRTLDMIPRHLLSSRETCVSLNMREYFAKPVKNGLRNGMGTSESPVTSLYSDKNIRLNEIMRIYEQLRVTGLRNGINMNKFLIFPEGVVSVPGVEARQTLPLRKLLVQECKDNGFRHMDLTFRPLILFPRLSSVVGWNVDKPAPGPIQQLYLKQLTLAIEALNAAKIAHLDLRPANIMWRLLDNEDAPSVELRLIDFEDAVPFGHIIPRELVRSIVCNSDCRYPFRRGDEERVQIASAHHNQFFLEAIRQWTSSETTKFGKFMFEGGKGLEILRSLLGT